MRLVDTTVAVDHLRGQSEATELLAGLIAAGEPLLASEIVRFELTAGVKDGELEDLEAVLSVLSWVPVDAAVSRTAGELARRYRESHSGIGDADYLIAATAVVLGADLLTTSVRHFPMIPGLAPAY